MQFAPAAVCLAGLDMADPKVIELLQTALNASDFEGGVGAPAMGSLLKQCKEWADRRERVLGSIGAGYNIRPEFLLDPEAAATCTKMTQNDFCAEHPDHPSRFLAMVRLREDWYDRTAPAGLIHWSDKIAARERMIRELGDDKSLVPVLFEQRVQQGDDSRVLAQALEVCSGALTDGGVVLKPANSCRSRGLVLIHSLDRCEATHDNGLKQETTFEELRPPDALTQVEGPLGSAPMALAACSAGVLVQPMVPHELEVRVVCVFGCAVTAIATAGPQGDCEFMYDKVLHEDGFAALKKTIGSAVWDKCVAIAEAVAKETDLLRVDLFVSKQTGEVLLNEVAMSTVPWC